MPKTDWSTRSSPERRRPFLPPAEVDAARDEPPKPGADGADQQRRRKPGAKKAPPRRHFVEPYPYTPTQREAIAKALAASGLGDATAREIFIGAIAYDLAVLAAAPAERRPPEAAMSAPPSVAAEAQPEVAEDATAPPVSAAERRVADQAQALAEALAALDPTAQTHLAHRLSATDPLRRTYSTLSLDALGAELRRLTDAVVADARLPAPAEPPVPAEVAAPAPGLDAGQPAQANERLALKFIRHAANVYEQCFDARPEPAPDAAFAKLLRAVAETTGIAIPTDAALLQRALG
jgi:hypothetical protein